jgi:hypothetical protein
MGQVRVTQVRVERLVAAAKAEELLGRLEGMRHADAEAALMMAYVDVSPGFQGYPEATRDERACVLLRRLMTAAAEQVKAVGDMSDDDVRRAYGGGTRTCQPN